LEIGGHIGYFTTFYAQIVGEAGKVDVFKPGKDNLKYLYSNLKLLPIELQKMITVVNKGAGDTDGELDFYIDPVTGQNNSFVKNFEVFFSNRENSAENNAEPIKEKVLVTRLYTWFQNKKTLPDFVKMDVEGFEWNVIQGFVKSIEQKHPDLMIEIRSDSEKLIVFKERGYTIYNDKMDEIKNQADYLRKKNG
jgi:FkbM family methyltransferase